MKSYLSIILIIISFSSLLYATESNDINKSFYFIRHGQTDSNKNKIVSGSSNIPLNDTGKQQALQAAEVFKKQDIKIIVASPMLRTRQTAEIIAEVLNVPIIYHEGLREVSWGVLEGQPTAGVKERIDNWIKGTDIEGAENINDFRNRIAVTFSEILSQYNKPLIVSHGGVFINLMDIIGLGYTKSKNAIPYYFKFNGKSTEPKYEVLILTYDRK